MRFSKELINETKAYFKKKKGRRLTDGQAAEYLEKLGALGVLAHEILTPERLAPCASVTAALSTGCKPVVLSRFEAPGPGVRFPYHSTPKHHQKMITNEFSYH